MKFVKLTREAPTNFPFYINPDKVAYIEPTDNGGSKIVFNSTSGDALASIFVTENNQQIIEQIKMIDPI